MKFRETRPNKSSPHKTLDLFPLTPSTPSRTLELKPSPMSPSTPYSVHGGSNPRRRSLRLAVKSAEEEGGTEQGNTLVNTPISENVIKTRGSSFKSKKDSVLDSNVRRSSRLASKSNEMFANVVEQSEMEVKLEEVQSLEKRKGSGRGFSLDFGSKKARVAVEDESTLEVDLENARVSDTESGESEKDNMELDELESKENLVGDVEEIKKGLDSVSKVGQVGLSAGGFGSTRRRSERIAKNVMLVSADTVVEKEEMKESDVGLNAIDNLLEVVAAATEELNSVSDSSSRRSQRLAENLVKGLEYGSISEARSGEIEVMESDTQSILNKRADNQEIGPGLVAKVGALDDSEASKADAVVAVQHNNVSGRRRYSWKEKGKGKLDLNLSPDDQPQLKLAKDTVNSSLMQDAVPGLDQVHKVDHEVRARQLVARRRVRSQTTRERHLEVARRNASIFAHSRAEEEEAGVSEEAHQDIEDWPGPFSTAMKIIKDRVAKENVQPTDSTHDVKNAALMIDWIPKKDRVRVHENAFVPSLKDLCLNILAKNAEAIVSLTYVPNELRNKLTQMLCDSRKMDNRFMDLLFADSPEAVCVKNCSWITEEQMVDTLNKCDTSKLSVLQLDLCGRCMPDYVIRTTLARSPNCLPALVALSLKGACRVTDSGLSSLVASSPSLRSINLGQCSLITATGIDTISNRLGFLLRELYLDDCQGIDAMLMLPSLQKLKCLEVLSLADMQSVSDKFISQFVSNCGSSLKELVLANCVKLTDTSMKAIAENCYTLCALDLTNLSKLTDLSISYIANGCPSIQKLKLCRNGLSDEAIAAFLETSGESLTELSLNSIKKVGLNTAISLAKKCGRNLLSLDLSWCRNLTDEALGYIVDSCLSLRLVKLFGCTQITSLFVDGHSNARVRIVGLKMTPILKHLDVHDPQEGPLQYSSLAP